MITIIFYCNDEIHRPKIRPTKKISLYQQIIKRSCQNKWRNAIFNAKQIKIKKTFWYLSFSQKNKKKIQSSAILYNSQSENSDLKIILYDIKW